MSVAFAWKDYRRTRGHPRNRKYITYCTVVRQEQASEPRPQKSELAATLRWFTAGGAIRIALRQLSQTRKLRHYDVIDDVSTRPPTLNNY